VYEIVDVVAIPKKALKSGSRSVQIANRNDLAALFSNLEKESELSVEAEAYAEFIFNLPLPCSAGTLKMTGYDAIEVDGSEAREIALEPLFSTIQIGAMNVMPKEQWLDGKRQMICSARFVEPLEDLKDQFSFDRELAPVSSKNGKPVLSAAGDPTFSAAWRQCTNFRDRGEAFNKPVGCDKQHYSESLFQFDAQGAVDDEIVDGIDPAKPGTEEQIAELDRVCETAGTSVMADGFSDRGSGPDLRIIGMPGPEWGDGAKYIRCELVADQSSTKELAPGSLVWTDGSQAKLIDAG
jgi:hypothetical protein